MNWERLTKDEKEKLLQTAKEFIDRGIYVGFTEEELARLICDKRYINS